MVGANSMQFYFKVGNSILYTDLLLCLQTTNIELLFLSIWKRFWKSLICKKKITFCLSEGINDNIRQLVSHVEMACLAQFCLLALPEVAQKWPLQGIDALTSCDTDRVCFDLAVHIFLTMGKNPMRCPGCSPQLAFPHNCFLKLFSSLIKHMTYTITHR
jgi:hypothetical protein